MGQFISYIKQLIKTITDEPLGIPEIFIPESDKEANDCQKPHEYIHVDKFTMKSLPEQLKDDDTFNLVKTLANLTVKIISPKRMAKTELTKWEKLKQKLMFNLNNIFRILNIRLWKKVKEREANTTQSLEGSMNQYGSGRIAHVTKATEKDDLSCPCPKCVGGNNKNKDLWIVKVFTATHVVPDTAAAEKTTCVLFHDSVDDKTDLQNRPTIYGRKVRWNHTNGDLCFLICVTCDSDLVKKLQPNFKEFNTAWENLRSKAETLDCRKLLLTKCPIVIVSHPHGGAKTISFGQIENLDPPQSPKTKELQLKRKYTLKYKACTCPGSSGAPVYVFGMNYFKLEFVHSGAKNYENKEENFNYSTKWLLENRDLLEE